MFNLDTIKLLLNIDIRTKLVLNLLLIYVYVNNLLNYVFVFVYC